MADILVRCDGCGHTLHPHTAHTVHEPDCTFVGGLCHCDTNWIVCATCCPTCNDQ